MIFMVLQDFHKSTTSHTVPPPLLLIDFTSFKIFLCFVVLIVNEEKNNHKMKIYVEVAVQVQLCESYFTTGVSVVFARACKN